MEPPSGQYPAVHFRHARRNVCFLDGHVESFRPGTRNPPPAWEPASATAVRDPSGSSTSARPTTCGTGSE